MWIRMAGVIALSCACGTVSADYGFEPVAALAPNIVGARALAVGDVTGDGRDDVVVLGGGNHPYYRGKVLVYAQRADGGFAPPTAHAYGNDSSTYQGKLGLADLDADGLLDIVVSYESNFQGVLGLLRNEGTQFALTTFLTQRYSSMLEFMDVDGDSRVDVVTSASWSWPGGVAVYHGDGLGGIRDSASYPLAGYTDTVQLADMDNDGKRDLVYVDQDQVVVQRHENGGFSPQPRALLRIGGYQNRVTLADFDGDGRTDIATVRNAWMSSSILIYPQGSDGRYRRSRVFGTGRYPGQIFAHDMNNDGRQDLVVPRIFFDALIGVFLGRQGGFAPEATFHAGGASVVAIGDLNSDGLADIAMADQGVSLLLSRDSAQEVDLGIAIGLVPNAAALRVDNHGTLASQSYSLNLRIDARFGSLLLGTMPEGCFGYTYYDGATQIYCQQLAPLAPGEHRVFAFPFALPTGDVHETLVAHATLSSLPDLRADNNKATKRLLVPPAANKQRR